MRRLTALAAGALCAGLAWPAWLLGPSWLRLLVVAGIARGVAAEVLRNPEIVEPEPRFNEVPHGQK
jgi:hypothetical protein